MYILISISVNSWSCKFHTKCIFLADFVTLCPSRRASTKKENSYFAVLYLSSRNSNPIYSINSSTVSTAILYKVVDESGFIKEEGFRVVSDDCKF